MSIPSPVFVRLTIEEIHGGACAGVYRQLEAMRAKRPISHGLSIDEVWDRDINGACREVAAAKALGIYWPGAGAYGSIDLANGIEVRGANDIEKSRYVLFHEDTKDSARYVGVLGRAKTQTFLILGWIYGHETKRQEWFRDLKGNGQPCYCVPRELFARPQRDIATLKSTLAEKTIMGLLGPAAFAEEQEETP